MNLEIHAAKVEEERRQLLRNLVYSAERSARLFPKLPPFTSDMYLEPFRAANQHEQRTTRHSTTGIPSPMKSIFSKNDYQILADIDKRRACIVKGGNNVSVSLEPLTPLSSLAAKHLRMMGCDPKKYLHIGHTSQVILKEAAHAWEEAVAASLQREKKNDTCLINSFWQNLNGLLELREAEDTYAACQKSASLMLESRQRGGPPPQIMELRRKYPRTAAYILAEAYAFSADEAVAREARKAMHILISNGDISIALAHLPSSPPEAFSSDQMRLAVLDPRLQS